MKQQSRSFVVRSWKKWLSELINMKCAFKWASCIDLSLHFSNKKCCEPNLWGYDSIVNVVWRMSWPTCSCLISKWYSHNRSASFRFSGPMFILLVEWIQVFENNAAPEHWYVKKHNVCTCFTDWLWEDRRSSSSRVDAYSFHVLVNIFALLGLLQ